MRKSASLSVLMLLLIGGCQGGGKSGLTDTELERTALAQKIELVEASGGLVLMVGGEAVTSDEIIESPVESNESVVSLAEHLKTIAQTSEPEQFKRQARGQLEEILTAKILNILLYQDAKRQAGKNIDEGLEKAVEREWRKFLLNYGGDLAKADEALKQMGTDQKSFKQEQKRSILIQSHIASNMADKRPVTHRELIDCYNEMKDEFFARPAMIKLRLIDIQPAKLEVSNPNKDRQELAKELAYKLLERIEAGEDFGELAKQYSHGHMREFGGLWKPVQPQSLAAPYDVLAAEAQKKEAGQIAGPIEASGHIFIMKLEEKQIEGYEPFEKVQRKVEAKIIFDRRNKVFNKLYAILIEQAKFGKTGEFINFCLEKIYQMSNEQKTQDSRLNAKIPNPGC
jgi:hypothetical protein